MNAISDLSPRPDAYLRLPEVRAITGLSTATLYRRIKAGEFPSGWSLGARAVGWRRSEVEQWFLNQPRRARPG